MGERLVFDLECDNLLDKVSQIWIVGIYDLDKHEYTAYTGDDIIDGLQRLEAADKIYTYNGDAYDLTVIEKLTGGLIKFDRTKHLDLCLLSRALFKSVMPSHKLKDWGEILDFPKMDYTGGFDEWNDEMLPYCEIDVRLTVEVLKYFQSILQGFFIQEGDA